MGAIKQLWRTEKKDVLLDKFLFLGDYNLIYDNKLRNKVGNDFITVSGATGSETFQIPNDNNYKTADTDNLWHSGETLNNVTYQDLISYDFGRTIVKYSNTSPYTIEKIGILKPDATFTADELKLLMNYYQLSAYWNETFISAGYLKNNRTLKKKKYGVYPSVLEDGNTVGWYLSNQLDTIFKSANGYIYKWCDYSGSGHDLKSIKGYVMLSSGEIVFDQSMLKAIFSFTQPCYIYAVVKQNTWAVSSVLIDGTTTYTVCQQFTASPGIVAYAGTASSVKNDLAVGSYGIVKILFNGANSKFQINNGTVWTGNLGSGNMNGLTLGGAYNVTEYSAQFPSKFAAKEIILRGVADSPEDESAIYAYLQSKYSL